MSEGEYELRCLSPQDLVMLGRSLESVYARRGPDGDLVWPTADDRPEELWFLIAMVLGHEDGGPLRSTGLRIAPAPSVGDAKEPNTNEGGTT